MKPCRYFSSSHGKENWIKEILKMWANHLLSVLLAALCLKVNAYPMYQGKIPNGEKAPNPCNRSTTWPGVGHQSTFGSGPRNPFGLDFAANNHVWNRTLCMKDSDGDGMTNGQELGDPNCTWTEGSNFTLNTNLSHPGVCEPLGSPLCSEKNSWLMNCSPGKLNCSAIKASGARNYTLRFPVTPIPTKQTTYICHQFTLPNDSESDIIAIEPVIDNAQILHHMLLYACTDQPKDNPADEAYECGMGSGMSCLSLIGIWGVGSVGQCLNSQMGFRIGSGGFQYGILQLHWNNPEHMTNLSDSSGMRIYHTDQLRPNRGQIAVIGQTYLEIPPHQAEVTLKGTCSSLCTKHLPRSIYLTSATLHMHTLGKSGDIILSRHGEVVQTLGNVTQFDYNTPRFHEYDAPIEVKPGDEIQVKCVYQSTQKSSTTHYGEATSDEMCYGFFAYYPQIEGLGFCGQWRSINICDNKYDTEFEPCDYNTYMKLILLTPYVCTENCTSTPCVVVVDGILATGCQNYPDVRAYINAFRPTFGTIFERCAMERPTKPTSTPQPTVSNSPGQGPQCTQQPAGSHSSGQGASLYFGFIITLMTYAIQE